MFPKGGWVCWKTFTAAPLRVFLPSFQAYYKGHLRWISHVTHKTGQNPLGKGLEAHPTGFQR